TGNLTSAGTVNDTFNMNGKTVTVGGNLDYTKVGTLSNTALTTFNGLTSQTVSSGGLSFGGVTITNSDVTTGVTNTGGAWTMGALTVSAGTSGRLTLGATVTAASVTVNTGGVVKDAGNTINLGGNWTNNVGTAGYVATGTVSVVNSAGGPYTPTFTGNTNFKNLTIQSTGTTQTTVTFSDGAVIGVSGTVNLSGNATHHLVLQPATTSWSLNDTGFTVGTVDYLDVTNGTVGPTNIFVSHGTGTGTFTGWIYSRSWVGTTADPLLASNWLPNVALLNDGSESFTITTDTGGSWPDLNTGNWSVNNLTVSTGASLTVDAARILTVNGTKTLAGTIVYTSGTVTTVTGLALGESYGGNLSFASTAATTWKLSAATGKTLVVPGTLSISTTNDTLDLQSNGLNLTGGTLTNTGTLAMVGSNTLTIVSGAIGGTVVYEGTTGGLTLSGLTSYTNLVFNGSGGTWTAGGAVSTTGTLTLTAGTLKLADAATALSVGGTVSGAGTIDASSVTASHLITVGGDWNLSHFTSGASRVEFTGASPTLTPNGQSFADIQLGSTGGTTALTLAGSLTQTGSFSVGTTGTKSFNMGTNGWTFGGTSLDLTNLGTLTNVGTVTFNGVSSTFTPNGKTFAGIVLGDAVVGNAAMSVAGNLVQTGNFSAAATGTLALTINAGVTWTVGGNVDLSHVASYAQDATATLVFTGASSMLTSNGKTVTNLVAGDTGAGNEALTLVDNLTQTGTFAVGSGAGTRSLTASGTWTFSGATLNLTNLSGTLTAPSTLTIAGSSTLTSNGKTWANLTLGDAAGGRTLILGDALNLTGNLTSAGTVNDTFNMNGKTVTVGGTLDYSHVGTLSNTALTTFNGLTSQTVSSGGLSFGGVTITNSDVTTGVTNTGGAWTMGALTVSAGTSGRLTLGATVTAASVTVNTGGVVKDAGNTINLGGNWTNNVGTAGYVATGTVSVVNSAGGPYTPTFTGNTNFKNLT